MPVYRVVLKKPEVLAGAGALRSALGKLKETAEKYQSVMNTMKDDWCGSGGRGFAGAAGKVQVGFFAGCLALEKMVYDAEASQRALTEQDQQAKSQK